MTDLARLSRSAAFGALLAAGAALLAAPAFAKTVAKVDGIDISDDEVKAAAEEIGASSPSDPQVVDYVIDTKLVSREAEKAKVDQDPELQRKLKLQRDKLMMEALLTKVGKEAVTPEALKKVYDEAAAAQKPQEELMARHILVPTEDEAKAVAERLKKGEDFAKVAAEVSKDPGSPGGELGWFTVEKMVPEFSQAASKLNKNEVSAPVKTQFGWHIIQLQDKRVKPFPPFEQVKDQVERYVSQKAQADYILKLRSAAKIEKTEPAPAPAPAEAAKPADPAKPAGPAKPAADPAKPAADPAKPKP